MRTERRRPIDDPTPPPDRKHLAPEQIAALKEWLERGRATPATAADESRGEGRARRTVSPEEVAALKDDLSASIDAFTFDPRTPDAINAPAAATPAPDTAADAVPGAAFPPIIETAGPWFELPPEPPRVRRARRAPNAAPPAPRDPEADRRRVDAALMTLSRHLAGFATAMNASRPMLERRYAIGPDCAIDGLRWTEGYVHHQDDDTATPSFDFYASFVADGAETLVVEEKRFKATAEQLLLLDLPITAIERSPADLATGRAAFSVRREIRLRLRFSPQYQSACAALEARNLSGIGLRTYWIAPDAVDDGALAELDHYILGRRPDAPALLGYRRHL